MRDSKECVECGGIYFRPENYIQAQWDARRYCSPACSGKAAAKRLRAAAKNTEPAEPVPDVPNELAVVAQTSPGKSKPPVVRELRVVRVGPNPRTVSCEYFELAERRTCTVMVKRNEKFVRGMRFQLQEPAGELEFSRPWVYSGPPPRRRGKW